MATGGVDPARATGRFPEEDPRATLPRRYYQLVVLDPTEQLGFAIEVAPPTTVGVNRSVVERMEFASQISASSLTGVLLSIVAAESDEAAYNNIRSGELFQIRPGIHVPDEVFRLIEYATFARIVPTEHSPIDGDSVATIAQQGIAFVGAIQQNPIVLIEGAGMLVVLSAIRRWGGAVVDVGEEAIRYHLPGLLRTPRRQK